MPTDGVLADDRHMLRTSVPGDMSPSLPFGGGISRYRAVVAAVFTALVVLWVAFVPLSPVAVALAAVSVVYFVANAFDSVRSHPLYDLASAAFVALLFALWYSISDADSAFLAALTVLAALGVVVEAYNYRHGTSHLRFDF
ncbi:hypothetical protein SAMN04488063_1421 [Halopelagius inordinatus]|uniref:Phosphatidate cytidylyltransferase n=2 Tax=Halopelagius inordinatus TaxID=553467 RepID=A0A1I2P9I5_9EURY|nr:hypothetical protein SAMN04488063_1421 [Halopelagius inordinatus]